MCYKYAIIILDGERIVNEMLAQTFNDDLYAAVIFKL